jgi:hypothetical protein
LVVDDDNVLQTMNDLVAEEHRLYEVGSEGGLSDEEHARLQDIEVRLDQCWDLLRQRRARRAAGADPGEAAVRPADTVEHYQQ